MRFKFRILPVFCFSMILLFAASCSSSKTYADRKRGKYSRTKTYASKKTNRSRAKSKTYSAKANKPTNAVALRTDILNTAKRYIGKKYVYGGKTPSGFDCSGFTAYVYNKNGVVLTGSSRNQAGTGRKKSKNQLQRGDLIFFGKGKVSHVGIVADVGSNMLKVIHATSSRGVVLEDISGSSYWQSRYLFGRDIISGNYAAR